MHVSPLVEMALDADGSDLANIGWFVQYNMHNSVDK
jgi:hypothetical protein